NASIYTLSLHDALPISRIRCNQARRLYEAVSTATVTVAEGNLPLPYEFGYEEMVATETGKPIHQRVLLTLWDTASLWKHAIEKGDRKSTRLNSSHGSNS